MWCPRKLILLTSFFGAKFSLNPSGSSILIWAYARKFHLSHAISSDIHYVHDAIFWNFLAFISFATWHGTFMQFLLPLKGKSCPHFILHFLWFLPVYCGILLWLLGHVPCLIHLLIKMHLSNGIFSTWLSIPVLTLLIALTWTQPSFRTQVHYR
jgi:hypothetical protein